MDTMQIATILSNRMNTTAARSALPNAPVVPDTGTAWTRGRAALAGLLQRAADAVAPSVAPSARRLRLSVDRGAD